MLVHNRMHDVRRCMIAFPGSVNEAIGVQTTVVGGAEWKQGPRKRRGDEVAKTPNSTRRVSRPFQLRTLHKPLPQLNKGCSIILAVRPSASVAVAFDLNRGPQQRS